MCDSILLEGNKVNKQERSRECSLKVLVLHETLLIADLMYGNEALL